MTAYSKYGDFMYYLTAFILFLADQITKYFTVAKLDEFESYIVIDGIINFTRFHNTGGPWSIFDNAPIFFIIATFIFFMLEFIFIKKHPLNHPLSRMCAVLINCGAVGNLTDRIFRGYVVDMIELKFIDYPVFNFADCCIVAGCVLMCIYVMFICKDDEKTNSKKDAL